MRIVSVNLNQRLGNPAARARFESWLAKHEPDVVLGQEPFRPGRCCQAAVCGYRPVGTVSLLCCWIPERRENLELLEHSDRCHEIRLDGIAIYNTYLSPYSSRARQEQLARLVVYIAKSSGVGVMVLGDFNLAPKPEDGLFDGRPSVFTTASERRAFEMLLKSADLTDMMCRADGRNVQFTLERVLRGCKTQFRCDLALVSRKLRSSTRVAYDHSVREGDGSFTDHSAIIVDLLNIEMLSAASRRSEELATGRDSVAVVSKSAVVSARDSHKTAIKRLAPSRIARQLQAAGILISLSIQSILDFGCGYGSDVQFYRSLGYETDGFDLEPRFGWTAPEHRLYDLVTMVFVINVLPTLEDRISAVEAASRFVRPNGYLLIAARSASAISLESQRRHWAPINDGWISSPHKGTFQKGISIEEIASLLAAVGFGAVGQTIRISPDVSCLLGSGAA